MRAVEATAIVLLGSLALLTLLSATATVATATTSFNITVPISGQIIGPDNQPLRNVTLYLVPNGNDTTRAIVANVTDDNGRFLLRFYQFVPDASAYPIWMYWLVSKRPIFYSLYYVSVGLMCGATCEYTYSVGSELNSAHSIREGLWKPYYDLTSFMNGTIIRFESDFYNLSDTTRVVVPPYHADFFEPTSMRCYLDGHLDDSITGNVTIKQVYLYDWGVVTETRTVTIAEVPLTNSLYFPHLNWYAAILRIPETIIKDGTTYRLSNVTLHFNDGRSVTYSGGDTYIITPDVSGVNMYYKSVGASSSTTTTTTTTTTTPGGTTQTPFATWISAGMLVAATASLIALSRGRKAAMAVMRERRALRAAP
jgi:hypothetical protein